MLIIKELCDSDITERSPKVFPHPVTQLLVPLWKVLFAAAKQIGCMSSVKFTGLDSFRRQMSLSKVKES